MITSLQYLMSMVHYIDYLLVPLNLGTQKCIMKYGIRAIGFLSKRLSIGKDEAEDTWNCIYHKYNGHIDSGIEKDYNISRIEYLSEAWNISADKYLKPDPDIRKLLISLNIHKAILSSAPKVWVHSVLKAIDLGGIFEFIVTGDENGRKPERMAYTRVLRYFNVKPEQAVMIDDDIGYLKGAKAVGIDTTFLISNKGVDTKNSSFATHSISNLLELRNFFE